MLRNPPSPPSSPPPAAAAPPLARSPRRRARLLVVLLVLGALVVVGAAALALRVMNDDTPGGTDAAAPVELSAPVGGPDRTDGPWVRLRVEPVKPGENTVTVRVTDAAGTPVATAGAPRLSVAAANLDRPEAIAAVPLRADADGGAAAAVRLDREGWWRLAVTANEPGAVATELPLYLLLPDPNLHGLDAVPIPERSDEAATVYARGLASMTSLHRVRYRQSMADGKGNVGFSDWLVNDGSDGQPPAFAYRAPGGIAAIAIGNRRWTQTPGGDWVEGAGSPPIPPSAWGEEYTGATGFRLGGVETVDGEPCRIVTFVVPEATEPRRRVAAWYAWWVGTESGQIRREAMVSSSHYMTNAFSDFDAPLPILPPTAAATPVGSPTAR